MPLVIKEYSWTQTPLKVSLEVPLTSTHNVDIFITEEYLKISALPYFFEAFLPQKIDVDQSCATKTETSVRFELFKLVPQETWECLSKRYVYQQNQNPKF